MSLVQPGVKNNASTETQGLCGVFCHFGGLVVVENPGIYALHIEFLTGIFPQQHYHRVFWTCNVSMNALMDHLARQLVPFFRVPGKSSKNILPNGGETWWKKPRVSIP